MYGLNLILIFIGASRSDTCWLESQLCLVYAVAAVAVFQTQNRIQMMPGRAAGLQCWCDVCFPYMYPYYMQICCMYSEVSM